MKEIVIKILENKLREVEERLNWKNQNIKDAINQKEKSEVEEKNNKFDLDKLQEAMSNLKFDDLVIKILKHREEVLIQEIKFKKNNKNHWKRKTIEFEEDIKRYSSSIEIIKNTIESLKKENE